MLNALCIRDGIPFSRVQMRRTARGVIPSGPALHRGQCRSISPSIASSCRLGRQIAVLYWTVLRKIFLAGQRHFLRSVAFQWGSPDAETVHLKFHPQRQLVREDPMAAAPAIVGWRNSLSWRHGVVRSNYIRQFLFLDYR